MTTILTTRLVAGFTAACVTYLLIGGVVSLAGSDPRSQETQLAKAKVQVAAAAAAPAARGKKL